MICEKDQVARLCRWPMGIFSRSGRFILMHLDVDSFLLHRLKVALPSSLKAPFLAATLHCHVWNKITLNRALFNTCFRKSKFNTQLGLPSKSTPKLAYSTHNYTQPFHSSTNHSLRRRPRKKSLHSMFIYTCVVSII